MVNLWCSLKGGIGGHNALGMIWAKDLARIRIDGTGSSIDISAFTPSGERPAVWIAVPGNVLREFVMGVIGQLEESEFLQVMKDLDEARRTMGSD